VEGSGWRVTDSKGEADGSGGRLTVGAIEGRVGGTTSLADPLLHAASTRRDPRATLI